MRENSRIFFKNLIIAFVIFTWLFCYSAYATIYYISPSGSDYNSGLSESSAWRNPNYALEKMHQGDTLFFLPGTYFISKKIKIYGKKNIKLQGTSDDLVHLVFLNLNDLNGIGIGKNSREIVIKNIKFSWRSANNGNIISIGGKQIAIRNCIIFFEKVPKPPKYDCVKILNTASDILIEECKIFGAPNQAIDAVGGRNITVRNNTIHDSQNAVVFKGGTSDCIIENNLLYNFIYGAIGLGGTTSSSIANSKNYEVRNIIVKDNVIYYDSQFKDNIGGGIFLMGAVECKIYNNTIYGPGIHIKRGGTVNKLQHFSKNDIIANNIILQTGNDGLLVIDPGNSEGLLLANNCFWATTGSGQFKINGKWITYENFRHLKLNQNSIWANPLFKDPLNHSFDLKTGSPCREKNLYKVDSIPFRNYIGAIVPVSEEPISPPQNLKVILLGN